jgi:hypothetical protein
MHNDTPLGAVMRLRELDRQAAPNTPLPATAVRTAIAPFLARLRMAASWSTARISRLPRLHAFASRPMGYDRRGG